MNNVNENNLIPVSVADLKAGQRLEKHTAADGSIFYVAQGVGSFVSGGKVFVEAQTTFTDDTSTSVVIDTLLANRRYVYTQPLTSLIVNHIETSNLESAIEFTAGENIQVMLPASLRMINSEEFNQGNSYYIAIRNNIAVMASYVDGE